MRGEYSKLWELQVKEAEQKVQATEAKSLGSDPSSPVVALVHATSPNTNNNNNPIVFL